MTTAVRQIAYVGGKAKRPDTIAGTGLVWTRGEVLPVPFSAARKLAAHPDIWADVTEGQTPEGHQTRLSLCADAEKEQMAFRIAELQEENFLLSEQVRELAGEEAKPQDSTPAALGMPSVATMKKEELIEYAGRELGIELDPKGKVADLRAQIVGAIESRDGPVQVDMLGQEPV